MVFEVNFPKKSKFFSFEVDSPTQIKETNVPWHSIQNFPQRPLEVLKLINFNL